MARRAPPKISDGQLCTESSEGQVCTEVVGWPGVHRLNAEGQVCTAGILGIEIARCGSRMARRAPRYPIFSKTDGTEFKGDWSLGGVLIA